MEGSGFTVTGKTVVQPVGIAYVITAAPGDTPVTMPVEPTAAIAVLLLLHPPPVVPSVNVIVDPAQTLALPVIAPGSGFTVIALTV